MLTLLLISAFALAFDIRRAGGKPVTIVVPDDYASIQDAINHASDGYTVFVKAGLYSCQDIIVNRSISLVGENKETTIIEGVQGDDWHAGKVRLVSDNVTFRGFTVRESEFAVMVESSNCLITDNNFVNNDEGICLYGKDRSTFSNTISYNSIANSDDTGICVDGSSNNHIAFNIIRETYYGIWLMRNSSWCLIERNEVSNNLDSGVVFVLGSSDNTLIGNNISNNGWRFYTSTCGIGFGMDSKRNRVMSNSICDNKIGVIQNAADDNVIYHNSFINNSVRLYYVESAPASNIWDNGYPSGGNYWSDYVGVDEYKGPYQNVTGSDGIGDTSLVLDSGANVDRYPLMKLHAPSAGDLNLDGKVDVKDVALVAAAYGSHPSNARWNPIADINRDDRIDVRDMALVCRDYGEKRP
jgi:parallel beta-helix repeat protein